MASIVSYFIINYILLKFKAKEVVNNTFCSYVYPLLLILCNNIVFLSYDSKTILLFFGSYLGGIREVDDEQRKKIKSIAT